MTNYPIGPNWTKSDPIGPHQTQSDHSALNIVLPPANSRTVTHSLTLQTRLIIYVPSTDVNTIVKNLL